MGSIKTSSEDGVVIVGFTASQLSDQSLAQQVGQELMALADDGAGKILLNLEQVEFISSAMVGQLLVFNRRCRARDIAVALCCVPEVILHVFQIVRLGNFIEIHDDVAGALGALAETAATPAKGEAPSRADDHREAAQQGDAGAQYELSLCYEEGRGVQPDDAEAQRWLNQSAEGGNLAAQYQMGQARAYGIGVGQDYAAAIQWYRQAAEQGHVEAQYAMGVSCQYGIGVDQDVDSAKRWYRLAADQGHVRAKEELETLGD